MSIYGAIKAGFHGMVRALIQDLIEHVRVEIDGRMTTGEIGGGQPMRRGVEAVEDARDGDEFTFDPDSRQLRNETQDRTYTPVPLSPKEEEIRRGGGIFEVGRREFPASVRATPFVADRRFRVLLKMIPAASSFRPGKCRPCRFGRGRPLHFSLRVWIARRSVPA